MAGALYAIAIATAVLTISPPAVKIDSASTQQFSDDISTTLAL